MSKLDKFKYIKFVQPENIESIDCTFEVLKLDKSKEVNELQEQNISAISVILSV